MMKGINRRLGHLEAHMGQGGRPLTVLMHLPPEELTDRELTATILGGELWKVNGDLTDDELKATPSDNLCQTLRTV